MGKRNILDRCTGILFQVEDRRTPAVKSVIRNSGAPAASLPHQLWIDPGLLSGISALKPLN